MRIHFHLTEDDYLLQFQHIMQRNRFLSWSYLADICKGFIAAMGFFALARIAGESHVQQVNVITAVFVLSWLWWLIWSRTSRQKKWLQQYRGAYSISLSHSGISTAIANKRHYFHAWSNIVACETTERYIYLYLQRNMAIIIPRSCFESTEQQHIFLAHIQQFWQQVPGNYGKILPTSPVGTPMFRRLLATLFQVLRAAIGLRFDINTLHASYRVIISLMLLNLLCYGTLDYLDTQPHPSFNPEAILVMSGLFVFCLAAAAFISRISVTRSSTALLLQLILACNLLTYCSATMLYFVASPLIADEYASFFNPLLLAWRLLVMWRIFQQLYQLNAPIALQFSAIYGAMIYLPAGILPVAPLFYANNPADTDSHYVKQLDVEKVFYQQAQLVERTLQQLKPQHPKRTDLYFVGFAGQAEEQVFSNEVQFAQQLLEKRFQAQAVPLLNNRETIEKTPLANGHNLQHVLNGLGKRMDKKQDVLFLFLSSHGAKNHSLTVSFWPMKLNDLKAEQLKTMLDDSGIQNRVIVVSACYSGGFLDVLKDEHTLILTASSRDHVSYGCGDYTQYTYFGEAYFVNALSKQHSFIDAFTLARQQIEAREKQENKEPSSPQIHVGKKIEAKLTQLTARGAT